MDYKRPFRAQALSKGCFDDGADLLLTAVQAVCAAQSKYLPVRAVNGNFFVVVV